ncbi:MAG: acyltransferase family protein [Candidatus Berkelbacteria bacterium]
MKLERRFRFDIEGLRAIAVLFVVLSHVGLGLPGGYIGVDIFFVISGFLITDLLFSELNLTKSISFKNFYARRIKRIIPAATLVLLSTLCCTAIWASIQLKEAAWDSIYASVSLINIKLALAGTNYFSSSIPSLFQNYWSLSVEEQFYLLWPALMLIVSVICRKSKFKEQSYSILLWLVIGMSLFASYELTRSSQPWAYFSLLTRAWELAVGALIAVNVTKIAKLPKTVGGVISWVGLLGMFLAVLVFNDKLVYPGLFAILPVVFTALVIIGCTVAADWNAEKILKIKLLQYLGKYSYSWYLWHWPIIVLLSITLGRELAVHEKILTVLGTLILAIITYHVLENPIHRGKFFHNNNARIYKLGMVLVIATICISAGVISYNTHQSHAKRTTLTGDRGGTTDLVAEALTTKSLPSDIESRLADAKDERYMGCIHETSDKKPTDKNKCILGNAKSEKTMVLLGDSHAHQWTQVLDNIAKEKNYKLITYTKSGCPPFGGVIIGESLKREYYECYGYNDAVKKELATLKPDIVILGAFNAVKQDYEINNSLGELKKVSPRIIYFTDTPYPGDNVPLCLSRNKNSIQKCTIDLNKDENRINKKAEIESQLKNINNVEIFDTSPWFCDKNLCPVIIGGNLVYYDDSHITTSYANTISNEILKKLDF